MKSLLWSACVVGMCLAMHASAAQKIDSVKRVAFAKKNLSESAHAFAWLVCKYDDINRDSCVFFANQLLEISQGKKVLPFDFYSNMAKGYIGYIEKNYDSAVVHFEEARQQSPKLNDTLFIGFIIYKLSRTYSKMGKYDLTVQAQLDGIKWYEKKQQYGAVASFYNNMAIAFNYMGDYAETIRTLRLAIAYNQKAKLPGAIKSQYVNLAESYNLMEKPDSSLIYSDSAKWYAATYTPADTGFLGYTDYWQGESYFLKGDYAKALSLYESSLAARKIYYDEDDQSYCYLGIGKSLHKLKKYTEAEKNLSKALELATKTHATKRISKAHLHLAELYMETAQYKKAAENYVDYLSIYKTMFGEEKTMAIMSARTKHQVEAKDREIELLNVKSTLVSQQLQVAKSQQIMLFSGLGITVVLIGGLFFVIRKRNQTNRLLQQQKEEITSQKVILENKNREITDSIRYAKRLQEAILPTNKLVKTYLQDSFVLYKPKDIVAGDFYWMESVAEAGSETILFAAADCTGHGVPGAMVSVVCHNALNRSVKEYRLLETGKILDKTREIVVSEFEKSSEDVKDGMDIALCSLTRNGDTAHLEFSGANNPLWIVRHSPDNAPKNIEELKSDKQPIGKHSNPTPFTTHRLELQKGDTLYLFTDGFADQFGGEKSKKYLAHRLKELFLSVHSLGMDEQRNAINQAFEAWKGSLEQVDDVCVIGVRI